jgi:hypothetical protein
MIRYLAVWAAVCALAVRAGAADDPEVAGGKDGAPTIRHAPVHTVVRGQPLSVAASMRGGSGPVTGATLVVKLTVLGKPTGFPMTPTAEGQFAGSAPVTFVEGVDRVWYYLEARAADGKVTQSKWLPVDIVDALRKGAEAGAGAAAMEGGGGGAGGLGGKALLAGGLIAGGAVAAILIAGDDDGDDEDSGGGELPATAGAPPLPVTGKESVALANTSPCFGGPYLEIRVCGTADGALIRAEGSWGASMQRGGYDGEGCLPQSPPALILAKPDGFPNAPGSETIRIYANGVPIATLSWPSADEWNNCR